MEKVGGDERVGEGKEYLPMTTEMAHNARHECVVTGTADFNNVILLTYMRAMTLHSVENPAR